MLWLRTWLQNLKQSTKVSWFMCKSVDKNTKDFFKISFYSFLRNYIQIYISARSKCENSKWNFFRLFYVVWVQFGSILQNYFGAKMLSVSYLSMIICFLFQQPAMSKPYWEVKQSFIWFSIRVCLHNLTIVKKN